MTQESAAAGQQTANVDTSAKRDAFEFPSDAHQVGAN